MTSCTTTSDTFPERGRSFFYVGCIRDSNTVDTCRCIEKAVIKEVGAIDFLEENPPEEKVLAFNASYEKNAATCNAENAPKE